MATYRSLRCDAPNLRIPRPLLSAVHPERRPTSAPLKFMLHTVRLQRASSVLLQQGLQQGLQRGLPCGRTVALGSRAKNAAVGTFPFVLFLRGREGRRALVSAQRSRSRGMGGRAWAARLPQNILQHSLSTLRPALHSPLYSPPRLEAKLCSAQLQGAHHAFSTSRRLLWLCVSLYCAVSPARIARRAVIPDSRSVSCGRGCTALRPRINLQPRRLCVPAVSTASPMHRVAHNAPCGLAVTPPPLLLCSALAPVPWPLVILSFATALSFGGSRYIKVARSWYYCHSLLVPFILYLLEYNNNTLYLNTTIH